MIDFNVKKLMKETLRKVFRFVFGQKVYRDRVTRPYVVSLQMQGRFADRVAVITGGAGAIGRATACRLALEGAAVVVCGRHADTLQAVVDEMVQNGGRASLFICDIMNEAEVEALVDYTVKTYGRLDFFCNVAGGGARSEAQEIKEILINLKRVDFINKVKEELYQRASDRNKINYYYLNSNE